MEIIWPLLGIIAVGILASIPAKLYEKKTGKKLGRGGAGAAMFVMNEIFNPSAANASIVVEEQKEKRVAIPSPEDKKF